MKPDRDARVVEARATRTWLGHDGIVRSQIRPGSDFTLDDSVAALAATRALAISLPTPVLVDCTAVRTASRASRVYWQGPEARGALSAMALMVGSPVSRVIASFFLRLVRPDFRMAMFSDEDSAVRWLKEAP